jgi:protein SCO1/2
LTRSIPSLRTTALTVLLLAAASSVHAFPSRPPGDEGVIPANRMPAPLRQVGYDQHLGQQVPLGLAFRDEAGRTIHLSDYFGHQRPVVMVMAYYQCPMLCNLVLQSTTGSLKTLTQSVGKDFDVVVASIAPNETPAMAAEKKKDMIARYGRTGSDAGWHFLTGSQESITALAHAVGFRYVYDPQLHQYAHPAGIVILTPSGRISRYLFGLDYAPRDVRLGLLESGGERIGSVVDQVLLYCFHYNPAMGRYSAMTMNILRLAAGVTILAMTLLVFLLRRRESRETGPVGAA